MIEDHGDFLTTDVAWECDCDEDYIHLKASRQACSVCHFAASEAPDARVEDVCEYLAEMMGDCTEPCGQNIRSAARTLMLDLRNYSRRKRAADRAAQRGMDIIQSQAYADIEEEVIDDGERYVQRTLIVRAIKDLMHAGREVGGHPGQLLNAAREQFFTQENP